MTKILKAASERVVGMLLPKVEAGACVWNVGDCCYSYGAWTCDGRCARAPLC